MTTGDHRTRVAAEKRERMRTRLIESALRIFAEHGLEAAAIDLIISEAGVSRGTFYNYYKTQDELIQEVLRIVANEMLTVMDQSLSDHADPARRMARGIKTVLTVMGLNPVVAQFIRRVGITAVTEDGLAIGLLTRDLTEGQAQGKWRFERIDAVLAMIVGAVQGAIDANARGIARDAGFAEAVTRHILLGLGIEALLAAELSREPLTEFQLRQGQLLQTTATR